MLGFPILVSSNTTVMKYKLHCFELCPNVQSGFCMNACLAVFWHTKLTQHTDRSMIYANTSQDGAPRLSPTTVRTDGQGFIWQWK